MAIIPEFFNDAVVVLGVVQGENKSWCATGFLVGRKVAEDSYRIFLVSNKHVFQGNKVMIARLNLPHETVAKDFLIQLINDTGDKVYTEHPDPLVDVACVYIDGLIMQRELGKISCFILENHALDRKEMLDNEITEGALVYTLGFPVGLVGLDTKVPICRLGCISKIKEPVNNKGYLIDTQNFPGSSGSPVINRLEAIYLEGSKHYDRTSLVGIIAAYIPYEQQLVSSQTGKLMQITQENSGLAIAYSVDAIKEVLELESNRIKTEQKKQKENQNESND